MPTKILFYRAAVTGLAGVMLLASLAACGGATPAASPTAASDTPTAVASVAPAQAAAESTAAPAAESADEAAASAELPVAPVGPAGPAACNSIEIPDDALTSPATADDWAKGPADAPITLIEYGDFQ